MKFITIRQFSRSLSKYISLSSNGDDIVITKNGHPVALLSEFAEDDIEDFILAKHFDLENEFEMAKAELLRNETVSLYELLSQDE
ncbi:MAG: type II toxin-antitoxin system Phd/YefM family antitoxin [Candidatus Marinimicrobia bacterium]|nr:type II toxin-antitoxin system Phd/YefM family antitoxin [Candidatus Neomarinimicrobiota bacterium]MCH8067859.1 type II toxin-antitoxin system Phd/YefM family antitoxin [Candidatus Neomarinimicrobiota bacterium]